MFTTGLKNRSRTFQVLNFKLFCIRGSYILHKLMCTHPLIWQLVWTVIFFKFQHLIDNTIASDTFKAIQFQNLNDNIVASTELDKKLVLNSHYQCIDGRPNWFPLWIRWTLSGEQGNMSTVPYTKISEVHTSIESVSRSCRNCPSQDYLFVMLSPSLQHITPYVLFKSSKEISAMIRKSFSNLSLR